MKLVNCVYTDFCSKYYHGKEILDSPQGVLDKIDNFFEQMNEIDWNTYNPDNFYVNILQIASKSEILDEYHSLENFLEEVTHFFGEVDGDVYYIE